MSQPVYRDPDRPVEERVDDLLERMTVPEKVGQLLVVPETGEREAILERVTDRIDEYHLGQVSPFGRWEAPDTPEAVVDIATKLQRYAVEETRLGIPLLLISNAVHGNAYVRGAAAFPHSIGMAATRDEELVEAIGGVTARELSATGAHQNYDPVCDVARDPRWGRTFETFGESTHLCARLGAAKVRGYQGEGVVATVKHFPAYGEPTRGQDCAENEISESTFRRFHLPAYRAAIEAGADAVMPCYNSVDGVPIHGSRRHLTDLLRGELGFDGFVVSDQHGVDQLHEEHRTAASMREAIHQAATAGVDAYLAEAVCADYADRLVELIEDGEVGEERLDEAVGRVLARKFELGLFEDPYVDPDAAGEVLRSDEHRDLAERTARESITLLENDGTLPLDPEAGEVLVAGPNADHLGNQFGGWSTLDGHEGVTVREGIEAATGPDTTVTYERGSGIRERADLDAARDAAGDADAAVLVLGESRYIHEFGADPEGVTGEFPTRSQLTLPDAQRDLASAVVETGTPTVVVLVSGRPLATPWIAEHAAGLLWAYLPGSEGGTAVGDALFGHADPGGVLPISVPRSTGQLPVRFNRLKHPKAMGEEQHPSNYDPLYAFGHGLSYTEFAYEDLTVEPETVGPAGDVEVSVTVENAGDRRGSTGVDCLITDEYSSRVTPVQELAGFDRVALAPGERERVTFPISAADLGVRQPDGSVETEPGAFTVRVADETASFEVERRL